MEFIEARWYTPVKATVKRNIDFIVLHDMEWPERPTTAEDCARMFATTDRKASAHYCVDADSIVQCVRENDIAYHAPPNTHSIGVEHAGYARQSRDEWLDDYGVRMLTLSAGLVGELLDKYDLPSEFLSPEELRAGKRGVTTHRNVSRAWGETSHTDPGPDFPIGFYMDLVREARATTTQEEDDMAYTETQLINFARLAVQAELGDENEGAFSDRVAQKVLAQIPQTACNCQPTAVDVTSLAKAFVDELHARTEN